MLFLLRPGPFLLEFQPFFTTLAFQKTFTFIERVVIFEVFVIFTMIVIFLSLGALLAVSWGPFWVSWGSLGCQKRVITIDPGHLKW